MRITLTIALVSAALFTVPAVGQQTAEEAKAGEAFRAAGGRVETEEPGGPYIIAYFGYKSTPKVVPLVRNLPGLRYVDLAEVRGLTNDCLANLKDLPNLQTVILRNTKIGDKGLAHLKGLKKLSWIDLAGTYITGEGLAHLAGCAGLVNATLSKTQIDDEVLAVLKGWPKLRMLGLGGTQVTDKGLVHLKDLTDLQVLSLDDTTVSDAGLLHLSGLKLLNRLYVHRTQVTGAGVALLQQQIPNLVVHRLEK